LQGALHMPLVHFGVAFGSLVEQTWHDAPHLLGSASEAQVVLPSHVW
jgi:hypothetical protein